MTYIADINTRIAGIPCLVRVTHFHRVQGSYSYNAASDMDYHGYTESDWEVCDLRGRKADWLAQKLTSKDVERIESEIERALS